jgi:hypothetical protein
LLCLHYVMVTVQGITQCIHSIAVPTLCNGNGSVYIAVSIRIAQSFVFMCSIL